MQCFRETKVSSFNLHFQFLGYWCQRLRDTHTHNTLTYSKLFLSILRSPWQRKNILVFRDVQS